MRRDQHEAIARSRRRRRQADADQAEARMHDRVGHLFGFTDTDIGTLPPAVQVGWSEETPIGRVLCLLCAPIVPSSRHVAVYHVSVLATKPCAVCGRRLDSHVA